MTSELYKIPRVKVPAEVRLLGQAPRKLEIFLGMHAQNHEGYERPSELLNGPDSFLPALDPSERMIFLPIDAVQVMTVPVHYEFPKDDNVSGAAAEDTSLQVKVVLEDGTGLRGNVTFFLPDAQRRIQSFLNLTERFFALRDGPNARLINKRRILWVRQI